MNTAPPPRGRGRTQARSRPYTSANHSGLSWLLLRRNSFLKKWRSRINANANNERHSDTNYDDDDNNNSDGRQLKQRKTDC